MPVDLTSLLADTLKSQGFEIEDRSLVEGASGASYPVSLVAQRDGDTFIVDALASRTVRDQDVEALASIVDDTGLDGALVLALDGADHDPAGPGSRLVEVWDRHHVARAVGDRVLEDVLAGQTDPDAVGPTPTDGQATDDPAEPEPASQTPTTSATPTEDEAQAPSQTPSTPTPDLAEATPDPEPAAADPEPATQTSEPEAATADDSGASEGMGVNQRDFVDPEDMLERAEQLMQKGEVEGGDAELIVEDDPEPTPEPDPEQTQRTGEPAPTQQDASDPDPGQGQPSPEDVEPAADGSDAEILDSNPDPEPQTERPGPSGQPPEPETAATARDAQPDASPDPDPEPATGSDPTPAAAAGPASDEEAFVSGATIRPRIDETEARRKAEEALFDVNGSRLELLPFQVYRYRAQLEGGGHSKEEDGEVWVSTQSGAVVRAPKGDMVDEPETAYERFQGSLSKAETKEAAREHLLERLERREELRQDYSESAVIERVRLEPDPETLELQPVGKAFAPRWRIEGQNGTIFVDAVTGELVHE